jgi:hypothetical protein
VLVQPSERQPTSDRLSTDLGEHREERLARYGIHVAKRAEQEDSHRAELASDELKKEKRRLICSVEIV